MSVFDFTDSSKPVEIAFFDRGPINPKEMVSGGYWSSYWYNGNIYAAEIARGIDVFKLKPSEYLTQNEIDAAILVRHEELNTQQQQQITWPAASVVARAYLDQLGRTGGIKADTARNIQQALTGVDQLRTGKEPRAQGVLTALDTLAAQVESEANGSTAIDAKRLTALAETLRGRAARLR